MRFYEILWDFVRFCKSRRQTYYYHHHHQERKRDDSSLCTHWQCLLPAIFYNRYFQVVRMPSSLLCFCCSKALSVCVPAVVFLFAGVLYYHPIPYDPIWSKDSRGLRSLSYHPIWSKDRRILSSVRLRFRALRWATASNNWLILLLNCVMDYLAHLDLTNAK